MLCSMENVGIVVCLLIVLTILLNIFKVVYIYVIGPLVHKVDVKAYGKWALVTGSTNGIGKEYARQLAARGCDIVLVSRSLDKLNNVAQEIEGEFKVQTKVIQINFDSDDMRIYEKLSYEIKDLEIGTLVNNVGVNYKFPEYLCDIPDLSNLLSRLVNVNIVATIRVTCVILPQMLRRRKGIVINVSSLSRSFPIPMLSVYGAAKAFVTKFSEGLDAEYSRKGIMVQNIEPAYVLSNMTKFKKPNFFAPRPKEYVQSALRLLGTSRNTAGYFAHSLMGFGITWLFSIFEKLTLKWLIRLQERFRRKAMKLSKCTTL